MNTVTDNLPIRICFTAPKAYPLFNPDAEGAFGGSEVDLYYLATELAKDENFAVSFITADYGQQNLETIEGVKIIKSLDFKKNPIAGAIKICKAMRQANAQIYMLKTVSPGMFLVAFFCRLYKKIFLYRTAHTLECDGTYLGRHRVLGRIFKWALRTARLVFTQNEADKKNLLQTTGVSSITIPNGHRLPKLTDSERDTILWVGRSAGFKRPQLFINLAEKTPDEHFTMICQQAIDDQKYDELTAYAKNIENLEFIERVPFDRIQSYFQRAKVFVSTSTSEGFPNTFIQACMCGTPILSLNVNPDGFLVEYSCGICCYDDLERLYSSLKSLLEEERYWDLGQNARKYVEERHDVAKIVEQYKELLVQLVEKQNADRPDLD